MNTLTFSLVVCDLKTENDIWGRYGSEYQDCGHQ